MPSEERCTGGWVFEYKVEMVEQNTANIKVNFAGHHQHRSIASTTSPSHSSSTGSSFTSLFPSPPTYTPRPTNTLPGQGSSSGIVAAATDIKCSPGVAELSSNRPAATELMLL